MAYKRIDMQVAQTTGLLQFNGGGTQYIVEANGGSVYLFYVDSGSDLAFKKSTDGGYTWGLPTVIFTGTLTSLSVWYDRWSGIAAGLIHLAYTESVTDDTLYRTVNTESSDALSTQTVIFAGASTAAGDTLSITRAAGGNVYCYTRIDAGTEGGFFRLPNANVPNGAWDAARTNPEALATQDMVILVPGFAADTQDIMAIFWDVSANEISRYVYDDSANTWAETSIATSMVEQVAATSFPHFAAAVDLANSRIVVVAWNGVDTANQDLLGWTVTESAITAFTTPVVLNATDDCALCGIGIHTGTGDWYVVYAGISTGGETWLTSVNLYYKVSTDDGATWGPETRLTNEARDITWLVTKPRFTGAFTVAYHVDTTIDLINVNVPLPLSPRAAFQLGV